MSGNWIVGSPSKVMPWPLTNNQVGLPPILKCSSPFRLLAGLCAQALYHDQGSAGFVDSYNVLQHTDCWLSMNPPDDHNITLMRNFHDGNYSAVSAKAEQSPHDSRPLTRWCSRADLRGDLSSGEQQHLRGQRARPA